ncbi:TPA: hypothetical protein U1X32_000413 [Streptococcus suis]|nr:hypothetical protein [Streptococcus suis]HEM4292990.1 hypothetical protein [Streptococcus suis]
MFEELGQIILILIAIGGILLLLYRLFLAATGLLLIGGGLFLAFMEVYGLYLLFTETDLFVRDFQTNDWLSFPTFFVGINGLLAGLLVKKLSKMVIKRLSMLLKPGQT